MFGLEVKRGRVRNFVFTLNNYTTADEEKLKSESRFSYLIYGREIGESRTPHLQGYAELKKQRTFGKVSKDIMMGKAYIARRKGTQRQARDYCMKDKDFVEIGTPKRKMLKGKLAVMLKGGATRREIINEHPLQYARMHSGLEKIIEMNQPRRDKPPKVLVLVGKTGTGKSYAAHKKFPDAYRATWPEGGKWWWPEYDHERVVILDEFREQIKYDYMLKLLDRYPFRVQVKGGHKQFNSKVIVITTNRDPKNWYRNVKDRGPLMRRLNEYSKIIDCTGSYCRTMKHRGFKRTPRTNKLDIPEPREEQNFIVYE